MAASNTRFTQNSLGQSKNPIDSDHGIYRYSARGVAQPRPANDRFRVIRTLRRHLGVTESDQTHLGHSRALGPDDPTRDPQQLANPQRKSPTSRL